MSLKEADRYIPHGGRCLGHKAGIRQVLQVFLFPAVMGSQAKKKTPRRWGWSECIALSCSHLSVPSQGDHTGWDSSHQGCPTL